MNKVDMMAAHNLIIPNSVADLLTAKGAEIGKARAIAIACGSHLPSNPPRCECHECTQARWKSSGLNTL